MMKFNFSTYIKIALFSFAFINISTAQNLYINEFMASNVISTPEIVDYDDYPDWIEIYNDSSSTINIGGYYLTDDFKNPSKWRIPDQTLIPAKGFLLFWADGFDDSPNSGVKHYHLNFKLSSHGEEIALFSPALEIIDSLSFSNQFSDVSFGRKPDGANNWTFFGESTPKASNTTKGTNNTLYSATPELSLVSGLYSGEQSVSINTVSNTDIRYTLDGSMPSSSSSKYESPIIINKTSTLRVRAFEIDKLPSKIITRSYFIDEVQNLPILSITAFPETLFGKEIGIYTNEIKSREVPVNVQLFEMDGSKAFEVDAGARLTGQASYQYPQKPLTIETNDKYGEEVIDYPVFANRPFKQYTSLYLRNSGTQDNRHTMFRDALQHTVVINEMDLDCQAYRPVVTYINGQYWGIYNIREKLDENYFVNHHGVNPDNLDYLEYEFSPNPNIVEGDANDYFDLQSYLSSNSMNTPENWEYVKSQIDVNEVMNYLITEIYCDNVNWPYTNSKWWKEKTDQSKWRYIFLDSDYGFGAPSYTSRVSNNTFNFLYNQPSYSSFVFRKLLENNDLKNGLIQRFATYLNSTFKKERVVAMVDSLQDQIATEMVSHIDRWDDYPEPIYGYPPIPNIPTWNAEVEIMRDFAERRPEFVKQSIIDFYNLSGVERLRFNLSTKNSGKITLGDIDIEDGFEGEYFRYVPIKIKAIPQVGYRFVKWDGVPDSLSDSTSFIPRRSDTTYQITAVFEEDNINIIPSTISSNMTLSISGSPYYARGNVNVSSGIKLTVDAGVEIQMPEFSSIIVNGSLEMNGSSESPITIKPNTNSGFNKWGMIYLQNTTAQSVIKHVKLIGATNGGYDVNRVGAISAYKADLTIDNATILDAPFPIFTQYGNIVVRNCKIHSDEVSDLINIKYAETALVENCDLRGNNAFDTDAIDYDQISNGTIRRNRIYNFYGFNSDGIDLGEGSKDILIEHNIILNCNDKGISVGQGSTTYIKKNIIVNCSQGVGIKDDSSFAHIDRNTFAGCGYGVASFEKNIGAGGGNAKIENSIFSKSIIAPVYVDKLSQLSVDYSLSDTKKLDGISNLKTSPLFTNNFILSANSPAINSGNPLTEFDIDGSVADLGAKYFDGNFEPIIFNEVHYNPPEGDDFEFVEIYNSSNESIITSGMKISGVINFEFPGNSFIGPKEYQVIAKNKSTYENLGIFAYQWENGDLPNSGGNIELISSLGEEIDFISYNNRAGWPAAPNGYGYSLELRNPSDENLITSNWRSSTVIGGSPGFPNKLSLVNSLFINELQAKNSSTITDPFGEYDDWIELYNSSNDSINLSGLYITDDLNYLSKHQILNNSNGINTIAPNSHILLWADGTVNQGVNHLNFKLNANGEDIALVYIFESDTTIISSVSFGPQEEDFSYARKDDGSDNWVVDKSPTPTQPNSNPDLFNDGILLVNGYQFRLTDVYEAYEDKAFWAGYDIHFWDLLAEPSFDYPSTLPTVGGHGVIPLDTLTKYSTVIWTGENNSLEENYWNLTDINSYVKMGGNLILLLKNGRSYIMNEMLETLGITWLDPENATISNCLPTNPNLDSIAIQSNQYQCAVFDTTFTNDNSSLLYVDTESQSRTVGIGLWNKPPNGGWYKDDGGQIVFLSGRGYRYNNADLGKNIETILSQFFNESPGLSTNSNDNVVTNYYLSQNFPNPFNPTTTIKYDLVKRSKIELIIFNILGQEVKTLVNEYQEKGRKIVFWNGDNNFNKKVSSGVYFYRISSGDWSDIKKMILLK